MCRNLTGIVLFLSLKRSCPDGKNNRGTPIGDILRKNSIYKEFILINQQSALLSNGKQSVISSIKSLHIERLKLQFMCEDDKYEQEKFQEFNQYFNEQETDYETDSDPDDILVINSNRRSFIHLFV